LLIDVPELPEPEPVKQWKPLVLGDGVMQKAMNRKVDYYLNAGASSGLVDPRKQTEIA
jgi:hypothetical protein